MSNGEKRKDLLLQIEPELLDDIEQFQEKKRKELDITLSRNDAIRILLKKGLEVLRK